MNLCVIPARGGSKRIPKKNIKLFCSKPLIAYSIENAQKSGLFEDIIVSTDDEEIAKTARSYGARVPFCRPKELSDDFATTSAVLKHAVEFLKKESKEYEYVCTLYATAPLLEVKYLIEGYEKLKNSDACSSFSVTSMPFPIWRTFAIKNGRCEMFFKEHFRSRSQDLEEAYQDAGQFYWDKTDCKRSDVFFGKETIPVILPRHLVQDIDTMEDFIRAEYMYKALHQQECRSDENIQS